MSTAQEIIILKDNLIKNKTPLYFSPDPNKKHIFSNIHTEPRNIYQEGEPILSKNQIKQKVNSNLNKNIINIQQQKNAKLFTDITDKNKRSNKSNKKSSSKLYLKKNALSNISSLNDNNGKGLSTQINFGSNTNINNISNQKNNAFPSRLSNIKFNIGKSSQNLLNSKNSTTYLKKNAESACELLEAKTKNLVNINNINHINYIYTSGNKQNNFLSPQSHGSNPKILFYNNEKNTTKDKFYNQNTRKESKTEQNQTKESENNNANDAEDKKNQINLLLKNTFTNVKIFPTTILNNKIIYNNEQNLKNTKNENSNNSSKIKKEKIVIETVDKKPSINKNESFNSIEELHYFYVDTFQKGKNIANELDK
jgi:hypothetical protein